MRIDRIWRIFWELSFGNGARDAGRSNGWRSGDDPARHRRSQAHRNLWRLLMAVCHAGWRDLHAGPLRCSGGLCGIANLQTFLKTIPAYWEPSGRYGGNDRQGPDRSCGQSPSTVSTRSKLRFLSCRASMTRESTKMNPTRCLRSEG